MINQSVLVGRLTKDVELRYTSTGVAVARFIVAVNRPFAKDGERDADFISCIAWRKTAENLSNYTKKGSLIGVTGRIQTGSYEGQDRKKVYTTDVIAETISFLESRRSSEEQHQPPTPSEPQYNSYQQHQPQQRNSYYQENNAAPMTNYDPNDDLPF